MSEVNARTPPGRRSAPPGGPTQPPGMLGSRTVSSGAGGCGPGLPGGRAGYRPGQLTAADEQERDRDGGQADHAAGPERPVEAAGQRGGLPGALVQQGGDTADRE